MIGGAKGIGIGIDFGIPNQYCRATNKPYIEKDVLDSLRVVASAYGKTNNYSDRAIVKNLVDPDNPFVISNAAYTEGSGYADKGSPYYGAFVTDGIDDLITSTKTVQEMLGESNEITVVSMIHQVKDSANNVSFTNYIRGSANGYFRNIVNNYDKTGIYGYTSSDLMGLSVVNNILGDKNDYTSNGDNRDSIINGNFSVQGYSYNDGNNTGDFSSVAWYWTIIANKVLTTDQINQVIAYFNLDRTLKSDIYCNIAKQGITNENHAEFGDKLIDFSGNGRDIQLNNIAWKGDSGIGKYEVDFLDSSIWNSSNSTITSSKIDCKNSISHIMLLYYNVGSKEYPDIPSFKVIKTGADIDYSYIDETGSPKSVKIVDGVNVLPASHNTLYSGSGRFCGFGNPGMGNSVTITQIPSHAGALCLDGVNDFGQFVGDLELKDYTFIADRAYSRIAPSQVPFIASTQTNGQAPFLMEYLHSDNYVYPHSFGATTKTTNLNIQRQISYQSTYVYNGNSISKGTSVDTGDGLTIGNSGSTGEQYSPLCLWSLMLFPYSMSEFLIERQLKKHKLGTLYPDMVEFRPVIKSSVELVNKPSFAIRGTSTLLNAGDYIPENSEIWVVIAMNNAADRITKFVINGNTIDIPSSAYNPSTMKYGFPFTIDSKSPQKITMTIEQDENYVQWNPVVTSNVEYTRLDFYLNNYVQLIKIGDYIPKDAYLRANLYLKNNVDELTVLTFNGVNIDYKRSVVDDTAFNTGYIYNYDSPQEVNITIDEYIRYEEIVQPYPVIFQITDRNTNQIYSWGDKIKVGSSIQLTQGENPNLLSGLYSIQSYEYEGETYTYNQLKALVIIITKSGIQLSCNKVWTFDNNEPNCILSPRLLRIPNSSYKILGHIPDISGHGNHGVIHNSAYAGMSGANGYVENFTKWTVSKPPVTVSTNEERIKISYIGTSYKTLPIFEYSGSVNENYSLTVEIQGIPDNVIGKFIHNNGFVQEVTNGINTIRFSNSGSWYGFTFYREDNTIIGNCDITIKQIGEYEGAFCLDGVDDLVTIPTLSHGGKQVLMKVNWSKNTFNEILYDQRENLDIHTFAIFNHDSDTVTGESVVAYNSKNNGNTYIDGILNYNIKASELKDIEHNITITNESVNTNNSISPTIGTNKNKDAHYAKMALYDFMLFDNISTDDKIKELNEYVGIEGNTE